MRPTPLLAFLISVIGLSCSQSPPSTSSPPPSPTASIVVRAPDSLPAHTCLRCSGAPALEAVADLVVEGTAGVAGQITSVGVLFSNASRTIEGPGVFDPTVLANFGVTSLRVAARGSLTMREIGVHFADSLRDQLPATLRFTVNFRDDNGHTLSSEVPIQITCPERAPRVLRVRRDQPRARDVSIATPRGAPDRMGNRLTAWTPTTSPSSGTQSPIRGTAELLRFSGTTRGVFQDFLRTATDLSVMEGASSDDSRRGPPMTVAAGGGRPRPKRKDTIMRYGSNAPRPLAEPEARKLARGWAIRLAAGAGLLAAATSVPGRAAADDDVHLRPCSNRTLRGDYGTIISGTAPAGPSGETETIVGTALATYDGHGHFKQVDNVHGQITGSVLDREGEGTYEVRADCSGTATLFITGVPFPIVSSFVIVGGGAEIKGAVMSPPGSLVTAITRKVK
jgi:hypothetical protein